MSNLVMLPKRGEVPETLRNAEALDFERVIVAGYKDGKVWLCVSAATNRYEIMGALSAAQIELWNGD